MSALDILDDFADQAPEGRGRLGANAARKAAGERRRRQSKRTTPKGQHCQPWETKRHAGAQVRCQVCGVVVMEWPEQMQGHVDRSHPGQEGWA